MKKLLFLVLAGFLGSNFACHATTVAFAASPADRIVVDSTSTEISTGSLVWEGTFSNTSFSFNPSISIAANVANIQSAGGWQQFGATNLGITSVFGHVRISGSVQDNTASADPFNGKNVYLWVFNAPTVAASTQMGIYTDAGVWVYPTNLNGAPGDTSNYDTSTTYAATAVGGAGSVTSSNMILSAASVPEPTTLVTLAGSAAFLGMLRRRRSARA